MVRPNNEDCFGIDLSINLLVLCDGMGGQAAGEVASKLGVETILDYCRQAARNPQILLVGAYRQELSPETNLLASGIRLSNQVIHEAAESSPTQCGMGSTVVAALVTENVLSVAHVGDSRLYLCRDGSLQQLTQDHSLVMEQVRKGLITREQAEHSELQNVIVRALGALPTVDVDLDQRSVVPGDLILLCSDGLTRMVSDSEIARILAEAPTAQLASDRLVEIANDCGGEDNVTVIVARLKPNSLWHELRKRARKFLGGCRARPR